MYDESERKKGSLCDFEFNISSQGSFAIVACPNSLSTISRLLATEDDEDRKDVSDILNNCISRDCRHGLYRSFSA